MITYRMVDQQKIDLQLYKLYYKVFEYTNNKSYWSIMKSKLINMQISDHNIKESRNESINNNIFYRRRKNQILSLDKGAQCIYPENDQLISKNRIKNNKNNVSDNQSQSIRKNQSLIPLRNQKKLIFRKKPNNKNKFVTKELQTSFNRTLNDFSINSVNLLKMNKKPDIKKQFFITRKRIVNPQQNNKDNQIKFNVSKNGKVVSFLYQPPELLNSQTLKQKTLKYQSQKKLSQTNYKYFPLNSIQKKKTNHRNSLFDQNDLKPWENLDTLQIKNL